MKYPHVNNFLKYHLNQDGTCTVVDYRTSKEYEMDQDTAGMLRRMDGSRPLSSFVPMSRQECRETEEKLLEMGILRKSRVEVDGPGSVRIALWMSTGLPQDRWRQRAVFFHRFVQIAWLPVLLAGLGIQELMYWIDISWFENILLLFSTSLPGFFGGLITGMFLHELSHAVTAVTYGGTVFEIGCGLSTFFPCGYVIMDEDEISNRIHKAQMLLAGVKMNFLLAGCSLLLFALPFRAGFLIQFSYVNLILGFLNLCMCGNTDGYSAVSTLVGIPQTWSLGTRLQVILGLHRIRNAKGINSGAVRITVLLLSIFRTGLILFLIYELWSWIHIVTG